jgi:hypothetical protein
MAENKLLPGIRLFKKNDKQPDFVLATGVITLNELVTFAKENPELLSEYNGQKQVKFQLLKSKDGNPYMAVDNWKPTQQAPSGAISQPVKVENISNLPF